MALSDFVLSWCLRLGRVAFGAALAMAGCAGDGGGAGGAGTAGTGGTGGQSLDGGDDQSTSEDVDFDTDAAEGIDATGGAAGKRDVYTGGAGGSGGGPIDGGFCCPLESRPACCMRFGGWSATGACFYTCDGMPFPEDPSWTQRPDAHGCMRWYYVANANCCGCRPYDAASDRHDADVRGPETDARAETTPDP